MKKTMIAAAILFTITVHAQDKGKAPEAAKTAFTKSFPGASGVKWGKEDANYEVDFVQSGKKMSAVYDAKGTLLETELSLAVSELPAAVMPYVNEHYKGMAIKETAKITKPNGEVSYEVGVKGKDILFNTSGQFLKEEKD